MPKSRPPYSPEFRRQMVDLKPGETLEVIADAIKSAATIMIIVATALAFGHWMTDSGTPAAIVQFTLDHHLRPWQFLLAINVLLLMLGCFLEVAATLLVVMPILAPAFLLVAYSQELSHCLLKHQHDCGRFWGRRWAANFVLSS